MPYPSFFGAEFLSLEASLVSNFSAILPQGAYANNGAVNFTSVGWTTLGETVIVKKTENDFSSQLALNSDNPCQGEPFSLEVS
jgi:hypothetical protein